MREPTQVTAGTPGWFFFSGGPGAPRYGDDPTKHAVGHDTETFVREVLQNANDQRLNEHEPVEVNFDFITLSGPEKNQFLEALRWDDGLAERLEAVTAADRGKGYEDVLERVADPGAELRLLIVEDQNTTGLTGEWDEDSNYAALVRDELFSSKQDDRAGGSYGLGKSVLWTFSGASTVVFNSTIGAAPRDAATDQRLIGRTKLPTHRLDDGRSYQGAGWLCQTIESGDGPRPVSLRGEDAAELADDLHLTRPRSSGTSMLVVDYRDPTRDERADLETLADEFVEAAVKYFWPAMHRGDLDVRVRADGETRAADYRDVPSIEPFVECFESRYNYDQTLETPGDVAGLDIPVHLPARSDGTETPDASVRLGARLASPADNDTLRNRVALFRGTGMVIKYLDQSRVAFGDRNFHAVLSCGEANDFKGIDDGDRAVERFLRFAEPPEHDEWESTENLREEYQRGFRTAIDDMFDTLRDGLRHLIAQSDGRDQRLSETVRKEFPIHGGQAQTRSMAAPSTVFDIRSVSGFEDDHWVFNGTIRPEEEEFEGWTAEISLTAIGEDGSRHDEIPIASVDTKPSLATSIEDGTATLSADSNATSVDFEGQSERIGSNDLRSGQVGETQLEIRAELRTEEDK